MIKTIGLEIHAELLTKTKIFCSCANAFGREPNTLICPICLGQPGTLPQLNQKVVELAVRAGLATHCEIHNASGFDRKNYMYPDLPKAYQITQFYRPIATGGWLEVMGKRIRIREIHLEEDAGKLIYASNGEVWVDYNRCGVPLIEIVTEPDMESAKEAEAFARELNLILNYAGVCDGHMEQGSFRMDVNLSLREAVTDPLGERTEIKNLNSYRSLVSAIEYEAARQEECLRSGEKIERQTRRFSQDTGETILMRSKESLEDYRYFPDPDVPDILLEEQDIEEIRKMLPELPEAKRARWEESITPEQAEILLTDPILAEYFDHICRFGADRSLTAAILVREGMTCIKEYGLSGFLESITPFELAQTVNLLHEKKILRGAVAELLQAQRERKIPAADLAQEMGLLSCSDEKEWKRIVAQVIKEQSESVKAYLDGKTKMEKFLMGQVMKKVGKGADPQIIAEMLHQKLESIKE